MDCENCKKLLARIADLERQLADIEGERIDAEDRASAACVKAKKAGDAASKAAREAADAINFVEDNTRALERARQYGDKYGEEQALGRLKRGW
jgi:hypothetical protein